MEQIVIERIKALKEHYQLTDNSLAKRIGIGQSNVSQYMNGKNKISLRLVELILDNFPDVSAEWLLRGEGNMLKEDNVNQSIKAENAVVGDNNHHINQTSAVKRFSAKVIYSLMKGCSSDEEREQVLEELYSTTDEIKQK